MRRVVLLLLAASLDSACRTTPAALRIDVEAYLARAKDWAPAEADTARTVERILATQFVDEAEVRRQVVTDAPRVDRHLDRIRTYAPVTQNVRDLHAAYVEAWETLRRGYEAILRGLDSGDTTELSRGREAIQAWRAGVVQTAKHLRQLIDDTGARISLVRDDLPN